MEFTNTGDIVRYWGDYGTGAAAFNLPSGVAVDAKGRVWVVDSGNGRVMGFLLP
jgi:secreted PhoX family phosphatase